MKDIEIFDILFLISELLIAAREPNRWLVSPLASR